MVAEGGKSKQAEGDKTLSAPSVACRVPVLGQVKLLIPARTVPNQSGD